MASQSNTDITIEVLGPGQADAEEVCAFLTDNYSRDSVYAHLGITDESVAKDARYSITKLETYHPLNEGTSVIARSGNGELVGALLTAPSTLADETGFEAQQKETEEKLASYGPEHGLNQTHQAYVTKIDKIFDYNGANFPEADHAQLWLNDPVVKEGFDAQAISDALLKARLSTEGTDRLRIGLMSSDKSKASLYDKHGLGMVCEHPLRYPDQHQVSNELRWRAPLDGNMFEQ